MYYFFILFPYSIDFLKKLERNPRPRCAKESLRPDNLFAIPSIQVFRGTRFFRGRDRNRNNRKRDQNCHIFYILFIDERKKNYGRIFIKLSGI